MISSCALNDTAPKNFAGVYQGTITIKGGSNVTSSYILNVVPDKTGDYLGTLNNLDANEEITMHCRYIQQEIIMECVAINIFKAQVFKLYGSTTHIKYHGDFEYLEKGVKEFEGDFILNKI